MSTLHERLLAELDPDDVWAPLPSSDAGRRSAALRAVVGLHKPVTLDGITFCPTCRPGGGRNCFTTRAIAAALGVEIGETP